MRTTLFLPTLLALGLASGAALADKSHGAVDRLRARGEVLDKSYRVAQSHGSPQGSQHLNAPVHPARDPGASRITCSEMGQDCPQRSSRSGGGGSEHPNASSVSHAPAFLDKVLGSDRTAFNEAGEAQQMSSHAVKRAWSHGGAGAGSTATLAHQQQHLRTGEQASANRMACNAADECMMSSKGAKKEWAGSSIKAGTWKGPEAKQPAAVAPAASSAKSDYVKVTVRSQRAAKTEAPTHDGEHD